MIMIYYILGIILLLMYIGIAIYLCYYTTNEKEDLDKTKNNLESTNKIK